MKSKFSLFFPLVIAVVCRSLATDAGAVLFAPISLGQGVAYIQGFDTPALVKTGTGTADGSNSPTDLFTTLPGWTFSESLGNKNSTYAAGDGTNGSGDTWSFGASTSASDRALGSIQDASLVSTFGAAFTRNFTTSGLDIYLRITFTGEQWRLGATGRTDRLDFQFSNDATSLTTGTWTDFNALDFTAPVTAGTVGALDGNATANKTAVSSSTDITVSVANGSNFWIRWNDLNATGADDGLGIDNFSVTALPEPSTVTLFGALGVAMLLRRRR